MTTWKWYGQATLWLALLIATAGRGSTQETVSNPGANVGIVRSQRLATGMPLGGLGTGGFQLHTDGTFGQMRWNNRHQGTSGDMPACFAALWTRTGGASSARILALKNGYGLPNVNALDFDGLYPMARVAYPDRRLPLTISLRAFSPLIPFDVRSSSYPAAAFVFSLRNTSKLPVEASIALSWQMPGEEDRKQVANGVVPNTQLSIPNTEYRTSPGLTPVSFLPGAEGFFGLHYGVPTPKPDAKGKTPDTGGLQASLLAFPSRAQAVVTTATWRAGEARPAWWERFEAEGQADAQNAGNVGTSSGDAGVVTVRVTLKPRESLNLPFAVSWYARPSSGDGPNDGDYYQYLFADSERAGRAMLSDWLLLVTLTGERIEQMRFSSLPPWLLRRIANCDTPLTTHAIHLRDGRVAFRGAAEKSRKTADNGQRNITPDERAGDSALERDASDSLLLRWFPQLSVTAIRQMETRQRADGSVLLHELGLVNVLGLPLPKPNEANHAPSENPSTPNPTLIQNPDLKTATRLDISGTAFYILQCAAYAFQTGDQTFAQQHWPTVQRALEFLLQHSESSSLPVPAFTTTGIQPVANAAPPPPPTNVQADLLRVAALRVGQSFAEFAGEKTAGARYANAAHFRGNAAMLSLTELLGQAISERFNSGPLIPLSDIRSMLQTQASVSPANPQSLTPKTEHQIPNTDLAALLQVGAPLQFAYGSPDTSVALWQQLDARRNDLSSPWYMPLRVDGQVVGSEWGSVTQASDGNILPLLEGFRWNGATSDLMLAPALPGITRGLNAPVAGPTFWGRIEYKPTARGSLVNFRLDRIIPVTPAAPLPVSATPTRLTIRTLRVPGPLPRPDRPANALPTVTVSLGATPLGVRVQRTDNNNLLITLEAPLGMAAGDRLEINARYE